MTALATVKQKSIETLETYWLLFKTTVPITIAAFFLSKIGAIDAVAPFFGPVMQTLGLPSELGLAWVTGMIVGIWGAIPLLFTLVPLSELSAADVTVFSALLLLTHSLPIEQKIIQNAGPSIVTTTLIRLVGGFLYAFLLHSFYEATGWLTEPVEPAWIPLSTTPLWSVFLWGLAEAMMWMLLILFALTFGLEVLRQFGVLNWIMKTMSPVLRLVGIEGEAVYLTSIGLFLGVSFGAGLLIRQAQSGAIPARQVFLSCVFMGFAHSLIDDTLLVMAFGADISGVLVGRLLFTFAATAAITWILRKTSDETFHAKAFSLRK